MKLHVGSTVEVIDVFPDVARVTRDVIHEDEEARQCRPHSWGGAARDGDRGYLHMK